MQGNLFCRNPLQTKPFIKTVRIKGRKDYTHQSQNLSVFLKHPESSTYAPTPTILHFVPLYPINSIVLKDDYGLYFEQLSQTSCAYAEKQHGQRQDINRVGKYHKNPPLGAPKLAGGGKRRFAGGGSACCSYWPHELLQGQTLVRYFQYGFAFRYLP